MLLFGINFNLYYFLMIRRFRDVFHSEELRGLSGDCGCGGAGHHCGCWPICTTPFAVSLRHAFFQVSSIITTTGFATADFNTWPTFSKGILVVLMFMRSLRRVHRRRHQGSQDADPGKDGSVPTCAKMLHPTAVSARPV